MTWLFDDKDIICIRRDGTERYRVPAASVGKNPEEWMRHIGQKNWADVSDLAAIVEQCMAKFNTLTPERRDRMKPIIDELERLKVRSAASTAILRDRGIGNVIRASDLPTDAEIDAWLAQNTK
jgi:hypothetical protein